MNTLEEKHLKAIISNTYTVPQTTAGVGDTDAAKACAEITKEEMKKFVEWIAEFETLWEARNFHNVTTTNELINFYLHQKSPSSTGGK